MPNLTLRCPECGARMVPKEGSVTKPLAEEIAEALREAHGPDVVDWQLSLEAISSVLEKRETVSRWCQYHQRFYVNCPDDQIQWCEVERLIAVEGAEPKEDGDD